nr:immunoglobulin heavy chain junction region [Mus musculus]MBK4186668.1 immunoglobulin heavy chain junction region [Mus musculus]MBK4186670.1 immunoglobulin heavy chain junction region [Mus musculus]
CTGYYGSSDYW